MHYLTQQERRWVWEGIEAAKKLAEVVSMVGPRGDEDEESEEFLHLASEIQEAALRIETLIDWEAS